MLNFENRTTVTGDEPEKGTVAMAHQVFYNEDVDQELVNSIVLAQAKNIDAGIAEQIKNNRPAELFIRHDNCFLWCCDRDTAKAELAKSPGQTLPLQTDIVIFAMTESSEMGKQVWKRMGSNDQLDVRFLKQRE